MPKIDAYPKMSKKGEGPRSVEFDPQAGLGGAIYAWERWERLE